MLRLAPWALVAALVPALAGCTSEPSDETRTGMLVGGTGPLPGAIAGLHYRAGSHSGFTDEAGRFEYPDGTSVVFTLGDLRFEAVPGRARVSPFQLANGSGCGVGEPLTHVLQILQSADEDGDPTNGIGLPQVAATGAPQSVVALEAGELAAAVEAVRPGAA